MKLSTYLTIMLFALLLSLASCAQPPRPDDLHPEDICDVCKMAVSEQEFAAQSLLPNGDHLKFDDVGCLLKHSPELPIDHGWVGVFDQKRWVRIDSATFLRTDSIRTPMGYGYLAFDSKTEGERAQKSLGGSLLNWRQMWEREHRAK